MNTRNLGTTGPAVSAIGLGAMGMSDFYGPTDEAESIATIHAAIDAGITLIDTGDFYGHGRNELLIAKALKDRRRDAVSISVKFGGMRDPAGAWQELPRLHPQPPRHRPRRCLPAGPRGPGRADRGDRRRDRRDGAGRLRPPRRALRGGRGDDSPR